MDAAELDKVVHTLKGRAVFQRQEPYDIQLSQMQVLYMRGNKPVRRDKLSSDWLDSSTAERPIRGLVGKKLNVGLLCALIVKKAASLLNCASRCGTRK